MASNATNTPSQNQSGDDDFMKQALRIMSEVPLIDGHNDFPYILRGWHLNNVNHPDFTIQHMPIGQTDLDRARRGRLGAQFWSAYVPCPKSHKTDDFSTIGNLTPLLHTLQQIDLIHLLIQSHPNDLALATSSAEIWSAFRSGKIACLIGVEGLHQMVESASVLRMYWRLGVRYTTLSHNSNNPYVDAALSATKPHNGLSAAGRDLVREMNRIGMIIDLSHTSSEAQRQVLQLSSAPVIFSHSSCASLCPHPRNVTDANLDLLKLNGGIIMICFLPSLTTTAAQSEPSLSTVAAHILHAGQRIGFSHVGIGSDFDGMLVGPKGLDDVAMYPGLVAELLRRGAGEEDVKGVCGGNLMRVLEAVERRARAVDRGIGGEDEGTGGKVLCDVVEDVWDQETRDLLVKTGEERRRAGELLADGVGGRV